MTYETGHIDWRQSLQLAHASIMDYVLVPEAGEELERMMVHVQSCHKCATEYIESLRDVIEERQTEMWVEMVELEMESLYGPDDDPDDD